MWSSFVTPSFEKIRPLVISPVDGLSTKITQKAKSLELADCIAMVEKQCAYDDILQDTITHKPWSMRSNLDSDTGYLTSTSDLTSYVVWKSDNSKATHNPLKNICDCPHKCTHTHTHTHNTYIKHTHTYTQKHTLHTHTHKTHTHTQHTCAHTQAMQ